MMTMTDTALPPDDEVAQMMLAKHAVSTAVNELLSHGHHQATVGNELHALTVMLPRLELADARRWGLAIWESVYTTIGARQAP